MAQENGIAGLASGFCLGGIELSRCDISFCEAGSDGHSDVDVEGPATGSSSFLGSISNFGISLCSADVFLHRCGATRRKVCDLLEEAVVGYNEVVEILKCCEWTVRKWAKKAEKKTRSG